MLESGTILQDRYRIEKQIGQGGMGSVYLATDERFNNTVAIKETLFTDENFRKAFKREARLLNSLKHTALPKVSDHFIDGNGQYIVMEYIAGDDLFEMIEQSGEAFPLTDVLIWAEQLLDALEYLHSQGNPIIHRDIKPQNLKLTPQGQVILLDFGLAKGNPTDANHQTAANSIFGYSRNYASLEQIQGTGTDPRSDIYSLAATLYHLVTGKPPADALTRVMHVLNEEKDPLQPAEMIHEQVPEDFSDALQNAMSLNANLRPQSAAQMRELLFGEQNTVVSTKPKTDSDKVAGTNLFNQNTKVFASGENPAIVSKQSSIKTELLPSDSVNDSIKTKFAKPVTLEDKKADTNRFGIYQNRSKNRKPLFVAAAISILFLVGGVASMAYLLDSGADNVPVSNKSLKVDVNSAIAETSPDENVNTDVNSENSNSIITTSDTNSNEMLAESNTNLEKVDNNDPSLKTDLPIVQQKEKLKSKTTAKDTVNNKLDNEGEIKFSNGKVIINGTTVTEDRYENKDVIIDENGITFKNPNDKSRKRRPPIPLTREQLQNLTPDQQKKIRDAMDIQLRIDREKLRREALPPPPPPRKPAS